MCLGECALYHIHKFMYKVELKGFSQNNIKIKFAR